MDSVNVRNLEQIQEADSDGSRSMRVATVFLAGIGGAALVIAATLSMKQSAPPTQSQADPLAALLAKAKRPEATPPEAVRPSEVTFPSILSDSERPTTALAAVKDERGHLVEPGVAPEAVSPIAPPPPADRLAVVPLPAGTLLDQSSVTEEPRDPLTTLATEMSRIDAPISVMPGGDGGYQLQVASFKDQAEADRFVEALLKRGHRAYRQPAYVADRGLWQRVRIGPFKTKFSAEKYKEAFEKKERMTAFLVDPAKVKRQEALRASKLASRPDVQEQ